MDKQIFRGALGGMLVLLAIVIIALYLLNKAG
jgi:flagellar biogenesis protein FliO